MASYNVSFDAASLIKGLNLQLETAIKQAVQTTAMTAYTAWKEVINQTPGLWTPIKDRYAASINIKFDPDGMGARIYSDDPMATPIETGIPSRDMKRMLDTSLKTRVVKNGKNAGKRYMIIPFRVQTPGAIALGSDMPMSVYKQVVNRDNFQASSVKSISFRNNQVGAYNPKTQQLNRVAARNYNWGSRLDTSGMNGLSDQQKRRLNGMVAFRTNLPGATQSSKYMTFRVMMEGSSGWIAPAQPGRYIVKMVSEKAQALLKDEVSAAIASVSGL